MRTHVNINIIEHRPKPDLTDLTIYCVEIHILIVGNDILDYRIGCNNYYEFFYNQ